MFCGHKDLANIKEFHLGKIEAELPKHSNEDATARSKCLITQRKMSKNVKTPIKKFDEIEIVKQDYAQFFNN